MRKIFAGLGILSLILGVALPAWAATEVGVAATVTVESISITVADGVVTYGTLAVNTSKDTTSGDLNDSQTATNNGNVTEDFNIKGQSSTSWTLAATADADQYMHEFCKVDTGDCDGTPTWTALAVGYQTLKTGVAKDGTYDFDLKVTTPTSTTDYDEQSVDVTVQAVKG